MNYISLFSGIEAASVAWKPLGWTPLAFSEIEPFPCAVLSHHWPHVPNHGDVTAFDWSVYRGKCDGLVGGSPCQSFSVAGLRGSLSDDWGNLALAFCKITHAINPKFVVYENVPGLLNTPDNAFGCLLAGLVGEEDAVTPPSHMGTKWPNAGIITGPLRTAAWRVLDSQFFGVPQRRRRVFVVSFRGSRNWGCAEALFPLSDGLPWDIAPSREAGKRIAASLTRGADSSGKGGYAGRSQEDGTGCGTPLVPVAIQEVGKRTGKSTSDTRAGIGIAEPGDPMFTLQSGAQHGVAVDLQNTRIGGDIQGTLDTTRPGRGGGQAVMVPVAFTTEETPKFKSDCALTVTKQSPSGGGQVQCVAFQERGRAGGRTVETQSDLAYSLNAPSGGGRRQEMNVATPTMAVRRLTPQECEKLQGFPPGHTAITFNGKPATDSPRYRAIGNSMAVPVLKWIGERIQSVMKAGAL